MTILDIDQLLGTVHATESQEHILNHLTVRAVPSSLKFQSFVEHVKLATAGGGGDLGRGGGRGGRGGGGGRGGWWSWSW